MTVRDSTSPSHAAVQTGHVLIAVAKRRANATILRRPVPTGHTFAQPDAVSRKSHDRGSRPTGKVLQGKATIAGQDERVEFRGAGRGAVPGRSS
jgi:hypothetical protein